MASRLFNVSKGRSLQYFDNVIAGSPTNCNLFITYYKAIESDALLRTRTSKADVEIEAANTVCDFDNFANEFLVNPTVGISDPEVFGDADTPITTATAGSSGAGTNNNIVKAILYYTADDTGSLTTAIPVCMYDFVIATNGNDLDFRIPASGLVRLG